MTDDQPEGAEPNDEPSDADTDETEASGIQEGDFVRLAYTARSVENDQLVDTTDQDVAEEEGVDDQQQTFEPRVIAVGAGHLFDAVEQDFIGGEAGDSGSVTVPAAEAFGEYDEEEVRTISAEKIPEDDRYPGGHVDIEGEHGHVNTIIGGRARVDFNHPLAGEDVEYDYEVLDTVDDRIERAEGMLGMYFDADLDMRIEVDEVEEEQMVEPDEDEGDEDEEAEPEFETEVVEKETLYIEQSPQLQFDQQWMMGKQQILGDLIDRLDLDRVIVEEVIDGTGGMMGGMGGMMGGMGGGGEEADLEAIEEELEDADIDADEITEELDDVESDE
ncbi:FKBP-type peptidyl-prolyl cis-trans isomerase [Halococcus saccharolyticus]|uniref:peptidylprolyl isomerase n=1 Tax=Halococcus saccharolyticus DSM 5350 TaxID=1227455 RepID=M0MH87_9EURY|nr:FKBP-type peptidyl-prolyl cis-trans isomerase [Halococcus saccharolyticus]EMA45092.1 FKBP-type peptidylprolyl isomerase [Halococcus saccharolyticus DSM 5350]